MTMIIVCHDREVQINYTVLNITNHHSANGSRLRLTCVEDSIKFITTNFNVKLKITDTTL